jgi:hypothetical protein
MAKQIIKIEAPYRERERKYTPVRDGELAEIMQHVLRCQDIFVTMDHERFQPQNLPDHLTRRIAIPREITALRERVYYADPALSILDHDIEIRQEAKIKYPVKQNIKVGHGANASDPTLDRVEHSAKLRRYGANLDAVDDLTLKGKLHTLFNDTQLVPVIRMVSQRTRLIYFPEGNPDIEIEMAFDSVLWGQCFDGFTWEEPKIEIELVKGADNDEQAKAILDHEERRLLQVFPLNPVYHSNPTPGMEHLRERLGSSKKVRRQIKSLKPRQFWWS